MARCQMSAKATTGVLAGWSSPPIHGVPAAMPEAKGAAPGVAARVYHGPDVK